MNVMGVGPLELFVVLLVAFLVLGPERMVDSARSIGKTVNDLKETFSGIPRTLDDLLQEPDEKAADESPGVARPRRSRRSGDGDKGAEE